MPKIILILYSILFSLFWNDRTQCARILGYVPTTSYSHQVVFHPLWRELSLRGHQVTVLTTNPIKDPFLTNLTEIDLNFSYEIWNKINFNKLSEQGFMMVLDQENFIKIVEETVDAQLGHAKVQALIKNETEHFDLLMVEGFFQAPFAFSGLFKCPMIEIFSLDAAVFNYVRIRNPAHPVLNPDFMLPFSGKLNFFQRLASSLLVLLAYIQSISGAVPNQQDIADKHFGKKLPPLTEIERNVSLFFINTDPIFHYIRPLIPSIIPVGGGTHLKSARLLPKVLQAKLDKASNGFIYFSLGSNVKSKYLPQETRTVLLEAFSELPYLVLWKFELENLPGKPDNVIVSKWFPQQDIFRHPNIKLFISQGGLQSTEEAIYSHIPIIGIPFFADQAANMKNIASKSLGLVLDRTSIDKESFKETILEVINNPMYRNKVQELAELARDQPMAGLERAIWWTEYVIRHKGAAHLRNPAMDLPLYQYFLLDVIGFCLLVTITVGFLLFKLMQLFYKLLKFVITKRKVKTQ